MKNVFLNVRTAKAQAGCAKVTKSSRMAKILTTLTLLLTLGVGQMWGGEYAGGAVYFDNSVTNWSYTHVYLIIGKIDKNGKNDWSTTYKMEPMTGTSYYHVSLPKGGWSDATYIAVAAKNGSQDAGNWSDINSKFTKYSTKKSQSGGLSQATYILTPSSSSNGFSFTLSSSTSIFSSCPTDVLNGSKIMVYAGEAWSWDQGFYRFMSSNNTSNTVATAAIRGIKKNLTNIGEVGFGPALLASGTYYQGHWNSGLSQSISAGKAYMVYSTNKASYIGTALATSGENSLYNVTKVNSSPTTSVTTTIGSSSFAEGTSSLSVSTGSAGKSVMNSTNTVEYYLYNGSTWSKVTVSAGSLNVSSLGVGSYKLATVLYDGYIYIKADEDDFEVTSAAADYTVTYDVHSSGHGSLAATYTTGGASIGASPATVASGSGLTFSATPSTYYTVDGWYSDAACTVGNRLQEGGDTYTVASLSGPLTVYVKFKLIAYTITYYLNGGDNHEDNPETYTYETSIITLQDPSKTGYTFEGWYTEVGLTNRVYSIPNHSSGDKAFWAKWTINSYNITYSPASAPTGATYTTTPSSANYNSTVDVVVTPTAASYLIQVTAVDAGSNTVTVTNPSANTYRFTMPASNVTVTVTATALPIVYVLKTKHASSSLGDGATGFPSDGKIWAWKASGGNNFYTTPGSFPGPEASTKATAITDDIIGDEWYRFIPDNISQFDGSTAYHVILTSTNQILNTQTTFIENGSSRSAATHTGTIWIVPHGTEANTAYLYTSYPDEIATPYNVTYNAGDHGDLNVFGNTVTSGNSRTISTTRNRTLTASPTSGYAFNRWITTGGVSVADATSATTTVSATGADGTVTATYFEEVNSGWYIKGNPAGSEWGTPTTLPLNRLLPGETDVYYRPVTLPANDQYFRFWHDETGKPEYGASYGNLVVSKDTKYDISKDDGKGGNAFKYSAGGTLWFVIDESAKKFWLQDPVEFYSVNFGYSDGCKTFSAKDGEGNDLVSGNTYVSGTALTFTQTKKDGYTFVGWNTAADGSGSSLGTGSSYTVASLSADVNVYAIYTENKTAITINTDGHGTITTPSPNNSPYSLGVATSQAINATASEGYHWNTWTTSGTAALVSSASTQSNTVKGNGTDGGTGTVTATFTPNTYTVRFHRNGGAGDVVEQNFTYGVAQNLTANTYTKTGYNFAGWALAADAAVTYADEANVSNLTSENGATFHLYAKWTPKQSALTFDYQTSAEGYGASGSIAAVSATYGAAMPALTGNMPTAAQGYAFMGFYSETGGNGTLYYNPDKTSAHNWDVDTESTTTLYAYYKKSEITAVVLNHDIFEPVAEATGVDDKDYVFANPTIEPTPVLPVKICWELLYDNGNSVPAGHEAIDDHDGSHPNRVKFSIAGLAAGGYKIKATLRTGDDCSGGTLLSEREVSFTIASGYTVTIQYKDSEGNTIAPSTTSPGKATDWTAVSAPDIFGYTFSTWVLGDGITKHGSDALTKQENFRFSATFNGTLTAQYTKNKYIYLDLSQTFSESGKWDNPWVYFYTSAGYWGNDNKGAGATDAACVAKGAMTQIEGTDIWYYDYSSVPATFGNKLAFTWGDKHNQLNFYDVDAIYRGDFSDGTPLFVPAVGQSVEQKNDNHGHYYNKGYWTNYVGDKTGYSVIIYDGSDNELKRQRFTSVNNDMRMTMKAALDLDAATTYKIEILRDNGKYYKKNSTLTSTNCTNLDFTEGATKGSITSTAAGSYIFTLGYSDNNSDKNFELRLTVEYPAAANDFQVLYHDNAEWSLGSTHSATWIHPSRIIRARENGVDTISFFVAKDNTPILKVRKVNSINASTGAITWGSLNINGAETQSLSVDSSAVYNFKVTQGATAGDIASIEYIGPYTGNYYIRCNALNSNWDNYTTDGDHRMTYSSFSESNANSFGEKYSHYKAKWCPRNTNIAFCIANDYSPCITDTLKQDVPNTYNNTDTEGTLKNDGDAGHSGNNAYLDRYSANVRFMWDRKTNKISRAYISAATSGLAQFLVLRAGQELHNENNVAISSSPANSVLLSDNENWIYEARLMIKPGTRFKLYACYAKSPVDPASAQYFRGAYDSDNFTSDDNSVILIGGESVDYQLARIVYDFKTNRLIAAWMPSGEVSGTNEINADIMVIRDHQESARCITFADASANLSKVKTVYGVMRFNRWILNNRQYPENQNKDEADLAHHPPLSVGQQKSTYERRLYFISFPFDVLVGDIFGFGTYGQYWVIQYYDGLNRAKKGYWMDSKPNWKYVSPTQVAQGYKLEKNQGYILELNLSAMAADNTTFWSNGISTIELYFPSTVNQDILKQTNCTIPALSDEYECKINRGTTEGDRRVKDSYWRCIGVPSYNLYNSALKDGSGNTITWKTEYTWQEDESEFPFIYMWNKTDNTLTPQATSTFTFQPMHAYLTQIKNAIVWTAVSAKPSSIVARRAGKEATKEYNWRIELKQDTTFLDQTYVRMTDLEQVTDSFDFGQDLIKELNSRSNIYTFIGYEKVAANSMTLHTDQTTVIPVGANITTEGEYTFALPDGADGIGVTLIDAETGTHTNLSAGMDYTVYLEKGTHDNRFWLEISPVQQTPTDIEAVSGQPSEVRKVLIDGILYIVKDGKLFDARGARVE